MKKVTRILGLCALMALVTVSCKKNENTKGSVTFKASITQPTGDAKTHIGDDNYLMWNEGDAIKVYNTAGEAETFTTSDKDVTLATFSGDITKTETYYACYPETNTIDIANAKATLALSATQQYAEGGFANGAYPMVAINSEKQFNFRSPFGVLCLQLKGTATVGSIVLTDSNMGLAGDFTVALDAMTAIASSSTTGNTITLSCPNVVLNPDAAKNFFMVVPAGAFAQGFTAVVKDMAGNTIHTLETSADNTLQAEHILTMPAITIEYATPSVTTNDATNVAQTTATINGEATAPAGTNLAECGFYWGTSTDALNNKVTTASATSPFSYGLTGLTAGTTYYFKAYAKNQTGENYGEVKSFTTLIPIEGKFLVSAEGEPEVFVEFASGNVWYEGSTGTWKFEDSQFGTHSFPGYDGSQNWGLFAFSTDGALDYNGNPFYFGMGTCETGGSNWENPNWGFYMGEFVDWAENFTGDWYTLTHEEWDNVIENHVCKYSKVNGIQGLIIMPYGWTGTIGDEVNATRWAELEADHACFLPAMGVRYGPTYGPGVYDPEAKSVMYWSGTIENPAAMNPGGHGGGAFNFSALAPKYGGKIETGGAQMEHGMCVRLVKPYVSGK